MPNILRLAEKELRFIIREFIELENLLKLAKEEGLARSQQEAQRLLVSLKKGLRKEERVEYHAARRFLKLQKIYEKAPSFNWGMNRFICRFSVPKTRL